MMKRLWIGLVACLLLVGCAVAPKLADNDKAKIKTVAVVSLIGEKFHRVHVGFMVLNHRYSEHAIDDWKLDDNAESLASGLLTRAGYQAVPLTVDRRALLKVHTSQDHKPLDFDLVRDELRAATAKQPVDAIVVLTKFRGEDAISNSNQLLEGVGLYSRGFGQRVQVIAPYAWYAVTVLDGKDLAPIARRAAFMPNPNQGTFGSKFVPPHRVLDVSASPGAFANLTDRESFSKLAEDDKRLVRQTLDELLRESLAATFAGVGLAPNKAER